MKQSTTILLVIGIILLVNVLSQQFFARLDLTENKQYTLSNATKDILRNLTEPVTIKAYWSDDLPTVMEKTKTDFREMLFEYNSISKGMVNYEFINPKDQTQEQEAYQSGVIPQQIQVRKDNELKLQNVFAGAVIQMGEQTDAIPFMAPGTPIEYPLSTSIKKLSVIDKPSIGLIQGHGEPGMQELQQVVQTLSILYNVENVDLSGDIDIPVRIKTVALVNPQDSIPPAHFAKLDQFLGRGGNMFISMNRVKGDLQTAQGTEFTTGLETWLQGKGLDIEPSFVVDAASGSVTVQQQQGFFRVANQVRFPYFPLVSSFPDHPVTKGLEAVMFPFASVLRHNGNEISTFTALATTSDQAGTQTPPIYFDINKQWTPGDFPLSNLDIGGVLEGNFVNNVPARIVVFSSGQFPLAGGQGSDNQNLMINSIDWLSDDTGLIDLRTKGVTSRPIKQMETAKQNTLKWLNFLLPIILVIGLGIFRSFRRNSIRIKRMQENYG
ncbi:MAG: GldG family protein [Bacteroidota bacterium]